MKVLVLHSDRQVVLALRRSLVDEGHEVVSLLSVHKDEQTSNMTGITLNHRLGVAYWQPFVNGVVEPHQCEAAFVGSDMGRDRTGQLADIHRLVANLASRGVVVTVVGARANQTSGFESCGAHAVWSDRQLRQMMRTGTIPGWRAFNKAVAAKRALRALDYGDPGLELPCREARRFTDAAWAEKSRRPVERPLPIGTLAPDGTRWEAHSAEDAFFISIGRRDLAPGCRYAGIG
jgi:hypothetical protein